MAWGWVVPGWAVRGWAAADSEELAAPGWAAQEAEQEMEDPVMAAQAREGRGLAAQGWVVQATAELEKAALEKAAPETVEQAKEATAAARS